MQFNNNPLQKTDKPYEPSEKDGFLMMDGRLTVVTDDPLRRDDALPTDGLLKNDATLVDGLDGLKMDGALQNLHNDGRLTAEGPYYV